MIYNAVFISDLHLHPENKAIQDRFKAFIKWASLHTQRVYILGDFFHVWAGDDCANEWSLGIAKQLKTLVAQGIALYFMRGNRDFLLGSAFAKQAGWTVLKEPMVIDLEGLPILLAHGDKYCTNDVSHQRFRWWTRNWIFERLFPMIPKKIRINLVSRVREMSQDNELSEESMHVVDSVFLKEMQTLNVDTLIHGHIHQPGLIKHAQNNAILHQFVLSDWDDTPQILCYHKSIGFEFVHQVI